MSRLHTDIETYSDVDISKAGLYKYAQSPAFEILLFAYAFDDEPVRIIDIKSGEKLPDEIIKALKDESIEKHAYNAIFEWYCIRIHFGFLIMPLEQWRCTMLHGAYCGFPFGLTAINIAMGIPADKRKLTAGKSLIKLFCTPTTPTSKNGQRTRTLPEHEPEKWKLFRKYCAQDVESEREVYKRLAPVKIPDFVQGEWTLDSTINMLGVKVDEEFINSAIYCTDTITSRLTEEASNITGLDNPNSASQLKKWLEAEGEEVPDLTKGTVNDLIKTSEGSTNRVLQIRKELAKTSIKKYQAMIDALCEDGRIRGLLQFYGANRTGRWAGRLVQIHNLPRNKLNDLDFARKLVKERNIEALKFIYGNVSDVLSQLIRTAFIPEKDNSYIVADFSAIEARVIAWLANEKWRLNVFSSHGKIYEASAAAMFGVPIESIDKGSDLRQKGKVAELALGYQGGPNALIAMGALNMGLSEEELPDIVYRWRQANPNIVKLWQTVGDAAFEVVRTHRTVKTVKGIVIEIETVNSCKFMSIKLPSGRKLYYVNPRIGLNRWGGEAIQYDGLDPSTKKWGISDTYGGKLVENIVQAVARDCLSECIILACQCGYYPVFHVHDEIIIEGLSSDLDMVLRIMNQPISWAPGLNLKGDGFTTKFYKKD